MRTCSKDDSRDTELTSCRNDNYTEGQDENEDHNRLSCNITVRFFTGRYTKKIISGYKNSCLWRQVPGILCFDSVAGLHTRGIPDADLLDRFTRALLLICFFFLYF